MTIQDRIRSLIKSRNTTQEHIAKEIGMEFGNFRRKLSNGSEFKAEQIIVMAKELGVSADFLLYGIEKESFHPALHLKRIYEILEQIEISRLEPIEILSEGILRRQSINPDDLPNDSHRLETAGPVPDKKSDHEKSV